MGDSIDSTQRDNERDSSLDACVLGHVRAIKSPSILDKPTKELLEVFSHSIVDYQGYDVVVEVQRSL